EQPEERLRDDRELAVVGNELEARAGHFQLALQLGSDEQRLAELLRSACCHGAQRADVGEREIIAWIDVQRELVRDIGGRYGGGHEMMLERRHPAARDAGLERPVLRVLNVELAIGLAVENGGTSVRIGLDLEVGALDVLVVAHELYIRSEARRVGQEPSDDWSGCR